MTTSQPAISKPTVVADKPHLPVKPSQIRDEGELALFGCVLKNGIFSKDPIGYLVAKLDWLFSLLSIVDSLMS